jgi:putative ATP-binding cassette transporter
VAIPKRELYPQQEKPVHPPKPYLPDDLLTHVLTYPGLANVSNQQLARCLKRVGLHHLCQRLHERQPCRLLSGGEQQRLSFARILLNQPELICLDESTSHLDDTTAIALISDPQRTAAEHHHGRQPSNSGYRFAEHEICH